MHAYTLILAIVFAVPLGTDGTCAARHQINAAQVTTHRLRATLLVDYDDAQAPRYPELTPVNVSVALHNIWGVETHTESLWVDATVHAQWSDCRLAWTGPAVPSYGSGVPWHRQHYQEIWYPQLEFGMLREHLLPVHDPLLTTQVDGTVVLEQRFLGKIGCRMDFAKMPYDMQTCKLVVGVMSKVRGSNVVLNPWNSFHDAGGSPTFLAHPAIVIRDWRVHNFSGVLAQISRFHPVDNMVMNSVEVSWSMDRLAYWYLCTCYVPLVPCAVPPYLLGTHS